MNFIQNKIFCVEKSVDENCIYTTEQNLSNKLTMSGENLSTKLNNNNYINGPIVTGPTMGAGTPLNNDISQQNMDSPFAQHVYKFGRCMAQLKAQVAEKRVAELNNLQRVESLPVVAVTSKTTNLAGGNVYNAIADDPEWQQQMPKSLKSGDGDFVQEVLPIMSKFHAGRLMSENVHLHNENSRLHCYINQLQTKFNNQGYQMEALQRTVDLLRYEFYIVKDKLNCQAEASCDGTQTGIVKMPKIASSFLDFGHNQSQPTSNDSIIEMTPVESDYISKLAKTMGHHHQTQQMPKNKQFYNYDKCDHGEFNKSRDITTACNTNTSDNVAHNINQENNPLNVNIVNRHADSQMNSFIFSFCSCMLRVLMPCACMVLPDDGDSEQPSYMPTIRGNRSDTFV